MRDRICASKGDPNEDGNGSRGFAAALLGCTGAPIVPPLGIVYTNIDAPISLRGDFGGKRGEASVTAYLGLFSTGDASVRAAARNGGISDVKHVG